MNETPVGPHTALYKIRKQDQYKDEQQGSWPSLPEDRRTIRPQWTTIRSFRWKIHCGTGRTRFSSIGRARARRSPATSSLRGCRSTATTSPTRRIPIPRAVRHRPATRCCATRSWCSNSPAPVLQPMPTSKSPATRRGRLSSRRPGLIPMLTTSTSRPPTRRSPEISQSARPAGRYHLGDVERGLGRRQEHRQGAL